MSCSAVRFPFPQKAKPTGLLSVARIYREERL
jgi:hypothetical protein